MKLKSIANSKHVSQQVAMGKKCKKEKRRSEGMRGEGEDRREKKKEEGDGLEMRVAK